MENNKQKSKCKNVRGRPDQYSLLEDEILSKYYEESNLGKCIKRWRFLSKIRKVMLEKNQTVTNFKYANCWFNGFC